MELVAWLLAALVGLGFLTTAAFLTWTGGLLITSNKATRRIEDDWGSFARDLGLAHSGRTGTQRVFRGLLAKRRLTLTALEHESGIDWWVRIGTWRPIAHRNDLPNRGRLLSGDVEFTLRKVPRRELGARLAELAVVVRELEAEVAAPWIELGKRHGLEPEWIDGPLLPRLVGHHEGRVLRLVEAEDDSGRYLEIRARWENAALGALEVARKDELVDASDFENPVLDMLLCARSDQMTAVRAAFQDTALTEAVLEVVHGHHGSRVYPGWVVLQTRRGASEAPVVLAKVLSLSRLLSAADSAQP